jgi:lipopolysaccharide/colanic/teichoic acid biosynthesis glycosyltransferase
VSGLYNVNLNNTADDFNHSKIHVRTLADKVAKRTVYYKIKRFFDIVFSLILMIITAPFVPIIAAIIFIDDPHGSPIFVQNRVGKDGKIFKLYKFRTMFVNAEDRLDEVRSLNEKDGPVFKIRKDPRVTRVGGVLRKISIDELPQLVNILKGDMSIVGPRPNLPSEVAEYTVQQRQRLLVTPGLTCTWQASPDRDSIPFEVWMKMDLEYINKQNFLLDIKIIFQTFYAVLAAQGN